MTTGGGTDEHLPLGRGNIDLRGAGEEMQRLNRSHPLILNMRRREDIVESMRFLEEMGKSKGLGWIFGKRGFRFTEVN
jgi:hypothetical protein